MRRIVTMAPALVVGGAVALALWGAPRVVREAMQARTGARVTLAQQRLDGEDVLERINRAVADIAESVAPSVVHIDAMASGRRGAFSAGAGWVYDDAGHVVTNAHVIRGADDLIVQFWDGSSARASFVGEDRETDIAVLRTEAGTSVIPARRAERTTVRVGERVYAFGSPFGFKFSMSQGIVSGVGRFARGVTGPGGYTNFLQTDAAVNPGNSGGPLVDIRGRVIGMNTAIVTGDNLDGSVETKSQSAGVGFAIPVETIESVVEQIVSKGVVLRGFLGVGGLERVDRESLREYELARADEFRGTGLLLRSVVEGEAADKAGVLAGDVITHVGGERVLNTWVLQSKVGSKRPGDVLRLTVWREGRTVDVDVTLGAAAFDARGQLRPVDAEAYVAERQGKSGGPEERAARMLARLGIADVAAAQEGVRLMLVRGGTQAHDRGFRTGQVVRTVNGAPVMSTEEFYRAVSAAKGECEMQVLDTDSELRLTLRVSE
ncbi:MAG: S1C family serine protease [Phycisphaerales bacterium]